MITHFDRQEILKYKKRFIELTGGTDRMSKEEFLSTIDANPMKERVALVFGYDQVSSMNFKNFLIGLSSFNCHGNNDTKLKVAFRLQDIDGDGKINRDDLKNYLLIVTPPPKPPPKPESERLTNDTPPAEPPPKPESERLTNDDSFDYDYCIEEVFKEASSDGEVITFNDFSRIIATTDFQTKLYLNL